MVRHYCELVASQPSYERMATAVETNKNYLESADRERNKAEHLYSMSRWNVWQRKGALTATYEAQELPQLRNFNG